ncbi:hypothetical protein QYE76_033304 [Lolium multiflorum]|uniref:Tf2-1-like SH3-like domain-containing protein n=1 Tax=Lolium multiflorum TaxID=4521 RepID=A0AAD8QVE0_LOLMU|nr:hypothetical protein QYE76_033304 [Lolium multiflorum]
MDPALKEYLDAMRADAAALETRVLRAMDSRFDVIPAKQDDLVSQIEYQSSYVFDLAGWRPELENRFAQLEAAVEDLKRAQPSTTAAAASGSGAHHIVSNTPPILGGPIHGQIGHGENVTSGGPPAVALGLPSVPPVRDTTHPFYFLTRFIEGLRADIRAVVMVQRPTDLDTACSLALLQEEVAEGELPLNSKQEQRYITFPRKNIASAATSSSPAVAGRAADSRGIEAARTNNSDKYNALRAYRKAKGLCFKCGEKWGHDHTCPQTVQLHVVEELLSLLSQEELTGIDSTESSSDEPEVICSVSLHALTGSTSDVPGVIQLQAFIEKHEILILVDSGSSTSFINQQLAQGLSGIQPLLKPCRVKVADGAQHRCSSYIPNCQWSSQGHQFTTDLKLLPLGAFDMILGMDWLEQNNPQIDWVAKTLTIQHTDGDIFLQGHRNEQLQCSAISAQELSYFGPYPISKCINPVAYEVQLPPEAKIHPVFHVSQLRKVLKQGMHASSTLPKPSDDIPRPVKILEHRWRRTPSGRREQIHVQWPPDSGKDLTWEDKLQLQHQFPELLAWGQAIAQGEGDVSSVTDRQKAKEEVGLKESSPRPRRIIQPNRRHTGPDWTR